jgi:two-component system, OmpR family, sensor kinase
MWDIDSPRAKRWIAAGWLTFAGVNASLMYAFPGSETIPYHLIWASFALLYGLTTWPHVITWPTFSAIVVITGVPLVRAAADGIVGWEECSEIVLMGVIAGLLVWHVDRQQAARRKLHELGEEERNRAAQRELATRFGSHEIRTRLTIARGLIDLLADDDGAAAQLVRDCHLASAELDKATALTNQLVTFVRADDATLPLSQQDLDVLVSDVGARWSTHSDRRWVIHAEAGVHWCDPERFEAALDCLIENAVKFTEPGDKITVEARTDGDNVIVSVSDTGIGIAPDEIHEVTKLFRTGSGAGARAGTGLGLAIVRAMAEARGGSLDIESTPGKGTTVCITTPAAIPKFARTTRASRGPAAIRRRPEIAYAHPRH